MTRLSYEQTLKDSNNCGGDPSSVTSLQLNHKALSDVSCLAKFENLEKLDLKLNNLTSLEDLRSCANLKWLCIVENKLESLEGIQGLSKLTVLNAGKNKLKSMDEVRSIVSLRALILNENEIASICKLDQMKELNTVVLSKNPICKIGDALVKVKSIKKLSLSHCRLQGIDSSLKSCVELRELRLAHNEIKSLPDELMHNSKLQNLDVGNNVITKWSELKVLKSLTSLRNLNLLGNPVATNEKITRKVKKALPRLRIFNARPVDKNAKEKGDTVDGAHDFSEDHDSLDLKETKEKKRARLHPIGENENEVSVGNLDSERKSRKKKKKTTDVSQKDFKAIDEENPGHNKDTANSKKDSLAVSFDPNMDKKSTKEKVRKDNKPSNKGLTPKENITANEKKQKKKQNNEKQSEVDVIDDAEASFEELFKMEDAENRDEMKVQGKFPKDAKLAGSAMTSFTKHKSAKMQSIESLSYPSEEIGMGGPSSWN